MKRCRKIQKDMDRYLDGELPAEKIHTFEDHLRACAKCRRALELKREQRRQRVLGLIPTEVPISTEEIIAAVRGDVLVETPREEALPAAERLKWWERIRLIVFRPASAVAFALCMIALGLSFFLPFGSHKAVEPGIVIEQIESSGSVMIFQPEHSDTTLIWIVPTDENREAT